MTQYENESSVDFASRVKNVIAKQINVIDLTWYVNLATFYKNFLKVNKNFAMNTYKNSNTLENCRSLFNNVRLHSEAS